MSDLSNRLALREQMQHAENVRRNREHEALLRHAPEGWERFKVAFREECDAINSQVNLTRLECIEPTQQSFDIVRVRLHTPPVGMLTFRFIADAPCIIWQDLLNKSQKTIEMVSDESAVHFTLGGNALVLGRFLESCIEAIWP